jgi:hypothetical protein
MMEIGKNARFLNEFFGAKVVSNGTDSSASNSSLIVQACPSTSRKKIAHDFLKNKFTKVKEQIDKDEFDYFEKTFVEIFQAVKDRQINMFGVLGFLFNYSAASFKKLFDDFGQSLQTASSLDKMIAGMDHTRTPLPLIIQYGVDSAVHIWEAILKSILIKEGDSITKETFQKAYEGSKKLLLDLTDIPLEVLIFFESYMFNRQKPYYKYDANDQAKERLGSDVNTEAIEFNSQTGEVNLNQEYMYQDRKLASEKERIHALNDSSRLEVHSCGGKQVIPLLFQLMDKIFEKHLFPNFDSIIRS